MDDDLAWDDTGDFTDAQRGLVASLPSFVVRNLKDRIVWDMEQFAYQGIDAPCPDTVHPSLWRQARLNAVHGLFQVCDGIFQVRGFDISNMTIIEHPAGVVVIDPLISSETAEAAWRLYTAHRGERRITAVIYTHSHIDHFGGVEGVVTPAQVAAGDVEIWAPDGFMEAAISENVFAGPVMSRRARYMYGSLLDKGPRGAVDVGLGKTPSLGTSSLIAPTHSIVESVQEAVVGGVRMVFQLTPGTEAPAEMNFLIPDRRALCMAENASHVMHNVLTIRGAQVRDAHAWGDYLHQAVRLFIGDTDVAFAQHHWPTWGRDRVADYLRTQGDMYRYLHDQTVRMMNQGLTGTEIAERFELPPGLARAWHCRGYYGSVSHNVKAIYQRYLGWYDGNPARLHQHPPESAGPRYVEAMGGVDRAVQIAEEAVASGDLRWAMTVLDHVLFTQPDHAGARSMQADTMEQAGFAQENATWRCAFLTGSQELRHGVTALPMAGAGMLAAMTSSMVFDLIAVRLDGLAAAREHWVLGWHFPDRGETWTVRLRHGVLLHEAGLADDVVETITIDRSAFDRVLSGGPPPPELAPMAALLGVLSPPEPNFAVVTP